MVPAYSASMAKSKGYDVYWMDGIAEEKTFQEWLSDLKELKPDLLMIETKAPVVKSHWKIVDILKSELPHMKVVLVGDHVTFRPKETMDNSKVDFIITGGDYDFMLTDLLNTLTKGDKLVGGIWGRYPSELNLSELVRVENSDNSDQKYFISGPLVQNQKLDDLPFVDRDLTKWKNYAYYNGNFKCNKKTLRIDFLNVFS
jgi:radical SAM superfamily enzyme YgiQ (UPF0313 family)